MRHKILQLFVNILPVNDKHFLLNRENLTQPIQMQLSKKQKKFFQFCLEFLKSILNFKHYRKKGDPHSRCISGNICAKNMVR